MTTRTKHSNPRRRPIPVMDRADYESLASAINEADVDPEAKHTLALEIATSLCATNDRFDPVRFLSQCDIGIPEETIRGYSHALRLRTSTGVGSTRDDISRERA